MKQCKQYSGIDKEINGGITDISKMIREACASDRQESRVRVFWRLRVIA